MGAHASQPVDLPSNWTVVTSKPVILRAGSETTSLRLGAAAPGSVVWVVELADLPDGSRRARTPQGWLTFAKGGRRNLEPAANNDTTALSFPLAARLPYPEPRELYPENRASPLALTEWNQMRKLW